MIEFNIISDNDISINDTVITDSIFEAIDYTIAHRDSFIDNLIIWISEATVDKSIMKKDLIYLFSLEDEYIFSSLSTNEYIAKSDNLEKYNKLCSFCIGGSINGI